jgi:ankyrin repeat protein
MPDLPAHPDLAQLRHQAKDLLRAAKQGDASAEERLRAASDRITLSAAQLALAREYGFPSWAKLKTEVTRRAILDDRDTDRLLVLLEQEPELATSPMEHWCDHPKGASPLGYVAMLRYDTSRNLWRDVPGTGAVASALLEAGALVDGGPGEPETPLITAASYGDAAVARVLIEAGADIEATSSPDSGGVPGGSALLHAAVFGMTDVVDVLVEAGARVESIEVAGAAGDVAEWLETDAPADARIRALVMAADHQRLETIDQLVASGVPVEGVDPVWGGHPLRTAAGNGRPESVRRLLALGADPDLADDEGRRPLDLARVRRPAVGGEAFDEVEAILAPVTSRARRRAAATPETRGARDEPAVTVEIVGSDLPGRSCGPGLAGQMYENVHVGLKHRKDGVVELVPGDASSATWRFAMTVRRDEDGIDFGGPFVYGRKGERALGLVWGELGLDDGFDVFRAAKLRLEDLDPTLVEQALDTGRRLVCSLGLTDEQGHPRCASVRPPLVAWSVAAGGG